MTPAALDEIRSILMQMREAIDEGLRIIGEESSEVRDDG